jgi:ATP adenylyltransferase
MTAYQPDEFEGVPTDAAADLAGIPDAFQRLWTPHRLVYIQHGQQPDEHACPFCRAPEMSDEQSLIVARGTYAYVLLNLYPYNSGHLLVCPYRHVATYDEATLEEIAEIGELTQIAMRVVKRVSCRGGRSTRTSSRSSRARRPCPGCSARFARRSPRRGPPERTRGAASIGHRVQ